MNNSILSNVILVTVYLANHKCFVNPQSSLDELKLTQDYVLKEISAMQWKVWIQMTSMMDTLEKKVEELESINKYGVLNRTDQQSNTSSEGCETGNVLISYYKARNAMLLKGFKGEKLKSRCLEDTLIQSLNVITVMENELKDHESVITSLLTNMSQLEQHLRTSKSDSDANRQTIFSLQKSHNDLLQDTIFMNESFHAKNDETMDTIRKPSFVSGWNLMRAQDPKLVTQNVFHGLGTLPYKVDVQILPTSGPNAGWIFSGDSAFQSDDDIPGEVYGGVVYLYDEWNVYITVPIKSNNHALGVVVNTGETNNRRLGNNHQTAVEAYVRVKVWAPSDLPEPDMKSEWLPLDIRNQSLTFYELPHSLNEYPGLLNIQIRCSSKTSILISEGLGATLMHTKYSNAGGVVYAFNEILIRIWTGYVSNTSGKYYYRLLGSADGCDNSVLRSFNAIKGHVRVIAWSRKKVAGRGNEFEKHEENKEFAELSAFKKFSPDVDLFSFYVQANEGANKGFRFPGYGSSQSIHAPFGGAVYAYNSNGDVRIWRPNPSVGGYLIHVHTPYGNGVNIQASNNAHYVSTLLRSK